MPARLHLLFCLSWAMPILSVTWVMLSRTPVSISELLSRGDLRAFLLVWAMVALPALGLHLAAAIARHRMYALCCLVIALIFGAGFIAISFSGKGSPFVPLFYVECFVAAFAGLLAVLIRVVMVVEARLREAAET